MKCLIYFVYIPKHDIMYVRGQAEKGLFRKKYCFQLYYRKISYSILKNSRKKK